MKGENMEDIIGRALARATDTKACVIGEGVLDEAPELFKRHFPGARRAFVVCDPRMRKAAGEKVAALLSSAGVEVGEHVLEPGGRTFHADYRYVEETRDAFLAFGAEGAVPVAAGSGVVNDICKVAEAGR